MSVFSYFLNNFTKENVRNFFIPENVGNIGAQFLILFSFWGTLWGLLQEDALPPNGYVFNTLMIGVMAHLSGKVMKLFNLPELVAMIIIGFVLNNRNLLGFEKLNLNQKLILVLRHSALVIVLLRAGFELDFSKLKKMSSVMLRLAFMPWIAELITIVVTTYLLLDFPIEWGLLTGFTLCAVSPAVIIPPIISLKKKGFGMDKGIPTLVIMSASIDDILVLLGFGVSLKLVYSNKINVFGIIYFILRLPIEPLIGILTGITIGLILWFSPPVNSSVIEKTIFLVMGGLAAEFAFHITEMRAAGPEASFVLAVVTSYKWRNSSSFNQIRSDLKDLWVIFEAFLFGLIGTEITLEDLLDHKNSLYGLICLLTGISMRFLTTILVVYGQNFTIKEKIFIGFSWLPKATLQVAVSSIVMELARKSNNQDHIKKAQLVINMVFKAVLLTAPLGAIAINILGHKILNKSIQEPSPNEKNEQNNA